MVVTCKTFVNLLVSKKQIDKFKRNHVSILKLPKSVIIKVEKILKCILDSILSPSPSIKIQILAGKFA